MVGCSAALCEQSRSAEVLVRWQLRHHAGVELRSGIGTECARAVKLSLECPRTFDRSIWHLHRRFRTTFAKLYLHHPELYFAKQLHAAIVHRLNMHCAFLIATDSFDMYVTGCNASSRVHAEAPQSCMLTLVQPCLRRAHNLQRPEPQCSSRSATTHQMRAPHHARRTSSVHTCMPPACRVNSH